VKPCASVLLALAMLNPGMGQATGAGAFTCTLAVVPAHAKAGAALSLRMGLTWRGQVPVQVLSWATPLEDWLADYLSVRLGGEELRYRGPMAKRAAPRRQDYITLRPGRERVAMVRLDGVFDFSRPGTYELLPRIALWDVVQPPAKAPRPFEAHQRVELDCPPLSVALSRPG
jgi:hypothetical protein